MAAAVSPLIYDPIRVRRDFPILERNINGRPLVYLDSAATALKPIPVIEAVTKVTKQMPARRTRLPGLRPHGRSDAPQANRAHTSHQTAP